MAVPVCFYTRLLCTMERDTRPTGVYIFWCVTLVFNKEHNIPIFFKQFDAMQTPQAKPDDACVYPRVVASRFGRLCSENERDADEIRHAASHVRHSVHRSINCCRV